MQLQIESRVEQALRHLQPAEAAKAGRLLDSLEGQDFQEFRRRQGGTGRQEVIRQSAGRSARKTGTFLMLNLVLTWEPVPIRTKSLTITGRSGRI
jgi:hypothetical protein